MEEVITEAAGKWLDNKSYSDVVKCHISLMMYYGDKDQKRYKPVFTFRLDEDADDPHLQSFYLDSEFEEPKEATLETARAALKMFKHVSPTVHVVDPDGNVTNVYNVESLYLEQVAVQELAEIYRTNKLRIH